MGEGAKKTYGKGEEGNVFFWLFVCSSSGCGNFNLPWGGMDGLSIVVVFSFCHY